MIKARLGTLRDISQKNLIEIWNRCWQGYYYNMTYSYNHLRVWIYLSNVSLKYSCAIYIKDRIIGFCLLSTDGTEGWIAGTCIDPNYRHQGFFGLLMRAQLKIAKHIGLNKVYLEALKQNSYALKVYQSVEFKITRKLNIYRLKNRVDNSKIKVKEFSFHPVTLENYFIIRAPFSFPAWQRREAYLRRYKYLSALINSSGTAGALVAGEHSVPLLDIWSSTFDGAKEVILYIFAQLNQSCLLTNQPEDKIATYLNVRGIHPIAEQFEMCVSMS